MHKERLLKLADLVEQSVKVDGFGFDMNTWGDGAKAEITCGTNACMIGVAALSGQFEGFTATCYVEKPAQQRGGFEFRLGGVPLDPIGAARELFGLTGGQAISLFLTSLGPQEGEEGAAFHANRLREFVKHDGVI
jgi:hypothetical protein